jgi:hypothetical protein
MNMARIIVVALSLLTGGAEVCAKNAQQTMAETFRAETFQAWEGGGFLQKKESGPPTPAIITRACVALGCSTSAAAIADTAKQTNRLVQSGNYIGTARVVGHFGEEYHAEFDSPAGYTICKAVIDIGNGSITGGATFNGSIQRSPGGDGLGLYAVVPQNRTTGQWVRFNLVVEYVQKDSLDKYECWPDRTVVFQCTGQNCSTYPGARL